MLGLVTPVLVAVLLGVATGGSFSGWSTLRLQWWPLAACCLLVQVALFGPPLEEQPIVIAWGPWLYLFSLFGVLAVLLANARSGRKALLPLTVAALGVGLNCLVIVANGGYMPRSVEAATSLGMRTDPELGRERLVNVQPLNPETRLAWLGDVIVQPEWLPISNVVSIGDLLLAGGLAWWAFGVTRRSAVWPARGRARKPRRARHSSNSIDGAVA